MVPTLFSLSLLVMTVTWAGRSTTRFYSLAEGGFHHHGGFLGGYHNFFRGNVNNSQDNFSMKYDNLQGEPLGEEERHHQHKLSRPVLEKGDPRLLLQIPPGRNSSTFFLTKLLNAIQ